MTTIREDEDPYHVAQVVLPDAHREENLVSTMHPHGPRDPRWIDDEGRCVLCEYLHFSKHAARLEEIVAAQSQEIEQLKELLARKQW